MRAVLQRVRRARVSVSGRVTGEIEQGLVALVGAAQGDTVADAELLADKTAQLRIFQDDDGKMNRSLIEAQGGCLVVSQFTLIADLRRGRRPYFGEALEPVLAAELVETFAVRVASHGIPVARGVFGAMMDVELVNDGPVTIVVDSELWRKP